MTLVDTGPLIALLDQADPDHQLCRDALDELVEPLLTTWPVVTEAMHFLGKIHGWKGQQALWRLLLDGKVSLIEASEDSLARMAAWMEKYRDTPMDLADASLVAAAEALGTRRVFSLDSDFEVYRLSGRRSFELYPRLTS